MMMCPLLNPLLLTGPPLALDGPLQMQESRWKGTNGGLGVCEARRCSEQAGIAGGGL